jgi:hypothetical protein
MTHVDAPPVVIAAAIALPDPPQIACSLRRRNRAVATGEARMALLRRRLPLTYAGYGALLAIVALWAWRAFNDSNPCDTEAAYIAGQTAWSDGHPEGLDYWAGCPRSPE